MGHYAKIDSNNMVIQVIVAGADFINTLPDKDSYIKTSYNTMSGVHYEPSDNQNYSTPSSDQSKSLRKNYAVIGGTYDSTRDAFIPPRPVDLDGDVCNSYVLDESTCRWHAPTSEPAYTDEMKADRDKHWRWDESSYQIDNTAGWVIRTQ
tara:strand:- start:190 stop:639 length:450 start_codon:yes stop_codon:yes gene_type:complete